MNPARIILLYSTAKHLKIIQIVYFVYYAVLKKLNLYWKVRAQKPAPRNVKPLLSPVSMPVSFKEGNSFTFLNLSHHFDNEIDWNFSGYGKLWTYQLNYFEFLHQPHVSRETGLGLISDYCRQQSKIKDGFEPYCISLRTIQWIKFLSIHNVDDVGIDNLLSAQVDLLKRRIEFHIQANHLLENAIALTAAGCYFDDQILLEQSWKLLRKQLTEQILDDGGHYERSPMYQLILLNRILDLLNIIHHYKKDGVAESMPTELREYAGKMIAWINGMEVNSHLPAFQDSTNVASISIEGVGQYAESLNVSPTSFKPGASGYRFFENNSMKLIIDAGSPQPDYQPGHAHAGALSWVLFHSGRPVVVDPGISTYESNSVRIREKGTNYHNTIQIAGRNQSEVWGSFRMGKRAKTTITVDTVPLIEAQHDGYRSLGIIHKRAVEIIPLGFAISDNLFGRQINSAKFILHFHPDCAVQVKNRVIMVDNLLFTFDQTVEILLEPYYFATDFNRTRGGIRAVIPVQAALRMTVIGKEKK